ncbi:hypothetical protein KEM56_004044 [Ascosphaera pollenicola]|nr:hypothetical protein KEM56_004044 [Ascosphaera pollenicola]
MGLDDFEKELVRERELREREAESSSRRKDHHSHRDGSGRDGLGDGDKDKDRHRSHRRHHHRDNHDSSRSGHHSHSRSHRDEDDKERHHHRHKRSRHDDPADESEKSNRHKARRERSPRQNDDGGSRLVSSKTTTHSIHPEDVSNVKEDIFKPKLQRDAWMEAPSALDIDYVNRPNARQRQQELQEASSSRMLQSDLGTKLHERELNRHLHDVNDEETDAGTLSAPAEHIVSYTFGDNGSEWRMVQLKSVYRIAEQTGRPVDEVAVERFGDLRSFDDAREEETELERRQTYGVDYVGKDKPSGELYEQRLLDANKKRDIAAERKEQEEKEEAEQSAREARVQSLPQGQPMREDPPKQPLDSTALNRLKAKLMKAKLRKAPEAEQLELEYNAALESSQNAAFTQASSQTNDDVVLSAMDFRMLADPKNEVKPILNKRGMERGNVTANEDMSVADMIREERRTKGGPGEGMKLAEQIAKDTRFDNDLEYMDDNAEKLARQAPKSSQAIRNSAINTFQKKNRLLDSCPLCFHSDTEQAPVAPVISLATRAYLTLPTEPEITEGGAVIVPLDHHTNLLECDDDEWEEIRNFMKSLTRLYHDQGRDVLFYENAANPHRTPHAAMVAVPIPYELGDTAPAFFREAILSADEEWTQHKKLIDTLANSKRAGFGRSAFRRSLVKEMPYFHVWFTLDGGLGHVVEDPNRWPRGDLFAREIIGGMVDAPPEIIKKQGRWRKGDDVRIDGFKRRWRKFDWTRMLEEAAQ